MKSGSTLLREQIPLALQPRRRTPISCGGCSNNLETRLSLRHPYECLPNNCTQAVERSAGLQRKPSSNDIPQFDTMLAMNQAVSLWYDRHDFLSQTS
jgi:hypothetical protein